MQRELEISVKHYDSRNIYFRFSLSGVVEGIAMNDVVHLYKVILKSVRE